MSNCIPEQRDRLRALAENVSAPTTVLGTDLSTEDPIHGVCLEVTTTPSARGLPPRVMELAGEARATVRDVSPQGVMGHHRVLVVVDR